VEMMVKVIQLKQALAEDFATLLQEALLGEGGADEPAMILSFIKKNANGSETVRKLLRQDIRVEADTRTNSLMVIAPPDSIAMLESMIREFDAIRPIRSELRLFPLINSDAENMADQLTQLFEAEGGGDGEAPNPLVFGGRGGDMEIASVGQKLRFAADARTNTLIAAGAEVDLGMVEDLIQILDAQTAETRVTEVYKAKFLQATDIASAVQGFNQQEQDVLGELDDEAAQTRRMARQISVESVGSEEDGSSSLIIGTDRRMYQRTMEMIQQLDRPEPQVRISVVVAEVTLTDNFEFGIELAGQELDFTRRAVTGSNGLILGPDFDFVGGTNLSAAGSGLGFNFTITGEDFSFLLHALQQNSRLEILSRPSLTITNGEEGNITIADQIPFVESSQINDTGSTNSVIGSEDVGIVLTATPQISPDGYVTIALQQEISNFAGENLQLTEGVSSPILSTREVITNVTVRDGETVVIGGLITSRISQGETKVPILGDLPFIGPLFRTTSESETKTELLIAMTVDVVRTTEDVRAMSIAERDRFVLPDSIRQSPLLEGLRIRPDKNLMGPHTGRPPATGDDGPEKVPSKKRELYGPRPRTYGPVVPRATSTTTQAAIYGPKIARSED
ncbi:MAG: secretin N-terminal domain-containing protein, partial [Phycisphaerae bacterium]